MKSKQETKGVKRENQKLTEEPLQSLQIFLRLLLKSVNRISPTPPHSCKSGALNTLKGGTSCPGLSRRKWSFLKFSEFIGLVRIPERSSFSASVTYKLPAEITNLWSGYQGEIKKDKLFWFSV